MRNTKLRGISSSEFINLTLPSCKSLQNGVGVLLITKNEFATAVIDIPYLKDMVYIFISSQ